MHKTEDFSFPKKWGTLQPKFIVTLVIILAVLGTVIGYFEISQSRKGIMALLHKEAQTVTEALVISAENAVQSYGEVEVLIENQLVNLAQILIQLHGEKILSHDRFRGIMQEGGVAKAFLLNNRGNLKEYAYPTNVGRHFAPQKAVQLMTPLFSENYNRTSGIIEDWEGNLHYAVAVKNNPETAWVLCADPDILLDFRKRVGIGRLIQDIGENEEIAFILLQDNKGIISASKNISSMPRLSADPFLSNALSSSQSGSRITQFNGQDVYEFVKPFKVQEDILGLIRVGLTMDDAQQAVNRTIQRAVVVLLGFIVIGVILFNFLVTNQNYSLLTQAYSKIKTYTGNILQNMADAVVAINRNGRITLFNRAAEALFGKTAEQALGRSCQEIIGKQTSLLDQTLSTGIVTQDEEVNYEVNGQNIILSVTTTVLKNSKGEIDSAVAVLKDLTDKKAWEERLRRQEKLTAMGELASGVAHEIRNPLNAISIIAQRFDLEFEPKNNQKEYHELANSIVSETQRVSQIISRFLEFARPPELVLEKYNIRGLIKKAVTLVEAQAKEQKISMTVERMDDCELLMDRHQMLQVFLNLLQNSLQATPAGGEIRIGGNLKGEEFVVSLSDTGTGIASEHLDKIFDLYFTTKEEGTGMGLSISHRIISEHGGRIEVNSILDKGSTFKVYLPINNSE